MLDSFPFTGWLSGQMLPSGSTQGSRVFLAGSSLFGAAFVAAGFLATGFSTRSGAGAGGVTGAGAGAGAGGVAGALGVGGVTGAGAGVAVSSGGHSRTPLVVEPTSSTAVGSGFGRKILANAKAIPVNNPSHRPMRNDRRITAVQRSSLDDGPVVLAS